MRAARFSKYNFREDEEVTLKIQEEMLQSKIYPFTAVDVEILAESFETRCLVEQIALSFPQRNEESLK